MAHWSDSGVDRFALEELQGCVVVVASGEIDVSTAPALRETVDSACESGGRIVVDLTGVTFMDSTGVGVLLGALRKNDHLQNRTMSLVGARGTVRKVLDLTGVSELLPMHSTVDEAVSAG
jgi:anti-sigma B factor antagonist